MNWFENPFVRTLGLYAAGSWLVLQVVDVLADNLGLPSWVFSSALVLLIVGLPIVLATAYFHGPGRTPDTDESEATETARSVFTWRNAILGGLAAFSLWGVVATVWLFQGRPGGGAEGVDGVQSIAVLPLQVRAAGASAGPEGGSSDAALFADGMHDDLLTQLSRIDDLRVTSRTSVEEFRDSEENIRDIAERLGVRYVVEGAVDRVGDRVRVNVQLIDASSDGHLWAETYDETMTLDNLFAIRDALTRRIAASLRAELTPEVAARLAERPTDDARAFDLYTRGRQLYERGSRPELEQAIDLFERAVELDPGFAEAHAMIAGAWNRQIAYGYVPREVGGPPARAATARALAIDPELTEGLIGRAVSRWHEGDPASALATLERAIELSPSNAAARTVLATLLDQLGLVERMLEEARIAHDLDPLSPSSAEILVVALSRSGRDREAAEQAAALLELHPDVETASSTAAAALAATGREEEAVRVLERAVARNPSSIWANEGLAWALHDVGRRDEALAQIERALERNPEDYPSWTSLAWLRADRGQFTGAREAAAEAVRLAPAGADTRASLARMLLAVGDTASAVAHLDTGKAAVIPNVNVHESLLRAGQVEAAVDASGRIASRDAVSRWARIEHARFLFESAPWAPHRPAAALAAFEAFRADEPAGAQFRVAYGTTLRELGHAEASHEQFRDFAAERPGSADAHAQLGWNLLMAQRDVAGAGDAFRRSLEIDAHAENALWGLARVRAREGRADSAFELIEAARSTCGWSMCEHHFTVRESWLRAFLGDEARAREILAAYEGRLDHPDWADWRAVLAATRAELGDLDAAFDLLDSAFDGRSSELMEAKVEPWYDPLRDDPRFDALLERLELVDPSP